MLMGTANSHRYLALHDPNIRTLVKLSGPMPINELLNTLQCSGLNNSSQLTCKSPLSYSNNHLSNNKNTRNRMRKTYSLVGPNFPMA